MDIFHGYTILMDILIWIVKMGRSTHTLREERESGSSKIPWTVYYLPCLKSQGDFYMIQPVIQPVPYIFFR